MRRLVLAALAVGLTFGMVAPAAHAAPAHVVAKKKHKKKKKHPAPTTSTTTSPTFAPQHFTGAGDQVVNFTLPTGVPAFVHVSGNASSGFFAVTSYDGANQQIDLLVNTTDPYDGYRPLNLTSATPAKFQVQASAPWTIDILPLASARRESGAFSGMGDDVVITPEKPSQAHITGNASSRFFAVTGYNTSRDLLVNTTDPYDGTVLVPSDGNLVMEIQASSPWTFTPS